MHWNNALTKALGDMGIAEDLIELAAQGMKETAELREEVRHTAAVNQWKVLNALQSAGFMEGYFFPTTGYGFSDPGRDALDEAVAKIFKTEAGVVRLQIVSGTHALTAGLWGCLEPGKELLSITGAPYDTILPVIGLKEPGPGSLMHWGVKYKELALKDDGHIDIAGIKNVLNENTGLVYIQRSRGYTWRPSLPVAEIAEAIKEVKRLYPQAAVMVDNCYGEMVELSEPTEFGADIIGGSLIKNMGGSIAPCGGYLAGRKKYIDLAMQRLTAPGIGTDEGPTLGYNRLLAQGLFMAPVIVGAALEGAIWGAYVMQKAGLDPWPRWNDFRTDIIQAVRLGSTERQEAFCRGVQRAGAIDHSAVPIPVVQPGYRDPILMAGGTFIQGSSIELSADGPERPPYACYLQGGVSFAHVQIGVLYALQEMKAKNLL